MKRLLYLLIILAAIAAVILVGYFLRYRSSGTPSEQELSAGGLPTAPQQGGATQPAQGQTPSETAGQQPAAGIPAGQKFGVVAQNPVNNYFVDSQNNVFIVQPDGQVIEISGGNANVLSSAAIINLIGSSFSYDGKKILAAFGDPTAPQYSVFDIATKAWQPLAQNLKSVVWSPNDYRVAYFSESGGVSALTTLDTSDAKAKPAELLKIRVHDLTLIWNNTDQILLSDKGSAFSAGSIWSFDISRKTLNAIVEDFPGLESVWGGTVNIGLVFSANSGGHGGNLRLIDTSGNTLNALSILTLPSKCTFDVQPQIMSKAPTSTTGAKATSTQTASAATSTPKTLYCAIPRDQQKLVSSALPDDYQKKNLFTADDFYKIDLLSGGVSSVFNDQSRALDADNPKIFNQNLFFVNRFDSKLYAVSLK
jgi:hypothetical protein